MPRRPEQPCGYGRSFAHAFPHRRAAICRGVGSGRWVGSSAMRGCALCRLQCQGLVVARAHRPVARRQGPRLAGPRRFVPLTGSCERRFSLTRMLRAAVSLRLWPCRQGARPDAEGRQAGQEEAQDRPCQAPHSVQPPIRQCRCWRRQEEGPELQQCRINFRVLQCTALQRTEGEALLRHATCLPGSFRPPGPQTSFTLSTRR